jgi:GTP-binding protein
MSFPISAEHGNGLGDMLDSLTAGLSGSSPAVIEGPELSEGTGKAVESQAHSAALREINLAIVGRPNVGKSSLLNRLLGEERAIVSPGRRNHARFG